MPSDSSHVKAKVYPSNTADFLFPETQVEPIMQKPNFGLAFSGGGTRSATLTLGQLRALDEMGLLSRFRYCSSVSGGTWGLLPFIYLDHSITDEMFLGRYKSPEALTMADAIAAPKYSFASAIANSKIFGSMIKHVLAGDEIFSRILSDLFLQPFLIGKNRFFSLYDEHVNEIIEANPKLLKENFYTVNKSSNRPYLIANATILRTAENRFPFEMTPLYVGMSGLYEEAGSKGKYDLGGGFIQPHGFDSDAPDSASAGDHFEVRLGKRRFGLYDVMGCSGAAPSDVMHRFIFSANLFPNFKYWSPVAKAKQMKAKEYDFGDGGSLENLGIMPLLRRQVKKIIVFANGKTELRMNDKGDDIELSNSIEALFQPLKKYYGDSNFNHNVVFANQKPKLKVLKEALYQKYKKGQPTIFRDSYRVSDQPHHDVKAYDHVDVLWVYNSYCSGWTDRIKDPEVKSLVYKMHDEESFPLFNTFFEHAPNIIDLNIEQANLGSLHASWMLMESENEIRAFLSGE